MSGISRNSLKSLFLVSTAISACMGLSPAFAQEGPQAAADTDSSEIVVTAQRRSEKLQDVPITIAVVNAEALRTTSPVSSPACASTLAAA